MAITMHVPLWDLFKEFVVVYALKTGILLDRFKAHEFCYGYYKSIILARLV